MAKQKKQPRPKAVTPKGFRDYFGAEVDERKAMLDRIAGVYHAYGFDALESSAVETLDALGGVLPKRDLGEIDDLELLDSLRVITRTARQSREEVKKYISMLENALTRAEAGKRIR